MSSNKIKLVYWHKANFGDLLSPFIVQKVSGNQIEHKVSLTGFPKHTLFCYVSYILRQIIKNKDITFPFRILLPYEENLLAIGSIIIWGNKKSKIWGSGFMCESETFKGGEIYAVRGKLTAEKLQKAGFGNCNVYGDPALLLPLYFSPEENKTHEIGLIPHWSETERFKDQYSDKYKIIDLNTPDIFKTIKEIISCKRTLCTSLHGIIVSHAYNIPSLWIKYGDIGTDGFKFHDYFSSVEIEDYDGFDDIDNLLSSNKNIDNLFETYKHIAIPKCDIKLIQKSLIENFPY